MDNRASRRPTFNGQPATTTDLYKIMDHIEAKMDEEHEEIEKRIRVLEDWRVQMNTYGQVLKITLGASVVAALVSVINLIALLDPAVVK